MLVSRPEEDDVEEIPSRRSIIDASSVEGVLELFEENSVLKSPTEATDAGRKPSIVRPLFINHSRLSAEVLRTKRCMGYATKADEDKEVAVLSVNTWMNGTKDFVRSSSFQISSGGEQRIT